MFIPRSLLYKLRQWIKTETWQTLLLVEMDVPEKTGEMSLCSEFIIINLSSYLSKQALNISNVEYEYTYS